MQFHIEANRQEWWCEATVSNKFELSECKIVHLTVNLEHCTTPLSMWQQYSNLSHCLSVWTHFTVFCYMTSLSQPGLSELL